MAAERKNSRSLHAADAAADHRHLFGLRGLHDLVLFRLHRLGVEGAAGHSHVVGKALVVGDALVVGHVEAGVVAADAGVNFVFAALHELGDPLGIRQKLPRDAHAVQLARGNRLSRDAGGHSSRANHGNVHELLDVAGLLEVAVLIHIHRRMAPIPGVVGAVVAVEHIVAGVLKELRGPFAFLHVAPGFLKLFAGKRAFSEALRLGDDRVAQRHREVLSAGSLDGLYDFGREAVPVFEAAAVAVVAEVRVLHRELVQQVALVDRVNLDPVNACVHAELGGLREGVDHLLDFLDGERARHNGVVPAVWRGAGGGGHVVDVEDGLHDGSEGLVFERLDHDVVDRETAAEPCGQLHEHFRAGLVKLVHKLLEFDEFPFALVEPLAEHHVADWRDAGKNQTDVVFRAVQQEFRGFFVEVVGLEPAEDRRAAHGGHDDAVFDFHVADLPGREQGFIFFLHRVIHFLFGVGC